MSGSIEMENVFLPENEVGMWHWLFGKSITSIVFRNPGPSDGFVGIAAPSLARILPVCAFQTFQIVILVNKPTRHHLLYLFVYVLRLLLNIDF